MPKIDEQHYDRGRRAFANGVLFRALVEPHIAGETLDDPEAAIKEISFMIGFVDGMTAAVRAGCTVRPDVD